jgi:hypothetical protein
VPGATPVVVKVMVDEPLPATEVGLNAAAMPAGNPVTLKLTVPEKPSTAFTATEYEALPPVATDWLDGAAVMVKSGVKTVPANVAAWSVTLPPGPVSCVYRMVRVWPADAAA